MGNRQGTIAILGANGRLGSEAARAFHAAGWQVRALARSSGTRSAPAAMPAEIERVAVDAADREALIAATRGVDAVFNGLNPPYPQWQAQVMPLARNVAAAVAANDALHLFPGNVYNFGTVIPHHPVETTAQVGDHRKAQIRIDAEALFEREAEAGRSKTIILRAGDFFGGTGTGSWFDLVITAKLAKGKLTYPGPLDRVHAWAYLPDLARAFVQVAENAERCAAFDRFHFGGHNVTGSELIAAMQRACGRDFAVSGFPWRIVRIAGLVAPMMREISQMSYLWRAPHALSGEKLASLAGPSVTTPLDIAVRTALSSLGHLSPSAPAASAGMASLAA
ncbi:MAG: NmrA family NAD(P)-binding protein [Nitratireductor sp.]|nr:NmrA family NAD(P)-binding protein [Nitratireductor sp.]